MATELLGISDKSFRARYFETLQTLGSSRWVFYRTETFERPDDSVDIEEFYRPIFDNIIWDDVSVSDSVQVVGPEGYGKSSIVKALSQKLGYQSSVLFVEHVYVSSVRSPPSLYNVLVSFLHQVLSQRPMLFCAIQDLMVQNLLRETWTEESVKMILGLLLRRNQRLNFHIIVYNFQAWSAKIRLWWSETLIPLIKSCHSAFTLLISSDRPVSLPKPLKSYVFDLDKSYQQRKVNLIRAKTATLYNLTYHSINFEQPFNYKIKKSIEDAAISFQGSFTAITIYLEQLFQSFSLSTLDTIDSNIKASPRAETQLWESEKGALGTSSPNTALWKSMILSWLMRSQRDLRIEELSTAAAVSLGCSDITKIRSMLSLDIERDLRSHFGSLVAIEYGYVRIANASAKRFLSTPHTQNVLNLQNDDELAKLCIRYLTLIINDKRSASWEGCLHQASWNRQTTASRDPILEFLDYACCYWPTHFLLAEKSNASKGETDASQKETNARLEDMVIDFLTAPDIGKRWFELYRLYSAQPLGSVVGDETNLCSASISEPESLLSEGVDFTVDKLQIEPKDAIIDARQAAIRIAEYIGLTSISSALTNKVLDPVELKVLNVRRGWSERNITYSDSNSRYFLNCAISNGDDKLVRGILESNHQLAADLFPFHEAALAGSIPVAQTINKVLDNVPSIDCEGRNPLHQAVIGGSIEMVHFLLNPGNQLSQTIGTVSSMIDLKDNRSETPLIIALRTGNTEAARALASADANLDLKDGSGKSALHHAIMKCPEIAKEIISRAFQGSMDAQDNEGSTPLHVAACFGRLESTLALVNASKTSRETLAPIIDALDNRQRAPLHYAAENGHGEIVKVLLEHSASMLLEDEDQRIAVELAVARGHLAVVKNFMSATEEIMGDRLLEVAVNAEQVIVVQYLLQKKIASPDGNLGLDMKPLSSAAAQGHSYLVHVLLHFHADVNVEDASGRTPLHHAAENGRDHIVEILLAYRGKDGRYADIKALDLERKAPLHSAAMAGHVSTIRLLLDHKADVKSRSYLRETALHMAVSEPKAVEILLQADAELNATDLSGQTPLHLAVQNKYYESTIRLLDSGADIGVHDDDRKTPLLYAILSDDLTLVKAICRDHRNMPRFQDQMQRALRKAIKHAGLEVCRFLLGLYPDYVNCVNKSGKSLVHQAARMASLEILTLLIDFGGTVNSATTTGFTPLHYAAAEAQIPNMQRLISEEANVDVANGNGDTPLHLAVKTAHDIKAVDVLLAANAKVNVKNSELYTPLYLAAYSGHTDIVKRLLEEHADPKLSSASDGWSPLHIAADDIGVTKVLFMYSVDINSQNDSKRTPLHIALAWSSWDVATFLIENKANVHLSDDHGQTALYSAFGADEVSRSVVSLLLDKGAALNVEDSEGRSPLHFAIRNAGVDMVQLLIERGADIRARTKDGQSCLSLAAAAHDLPDTLETLLDIKPSTTSDALWSYEDMLDGYWTAIREYSSVGLKVLVERERRLLREVSKEGLTGLETCLYERKYSKDKDLMLLKFLELGVDPFERHQASRKTCFELGVMTRKRLNRQFIDACLRLKLKEPSSTDSTPSFMELRIAIELDSLDRWKEQGSVENEVLLASDGDGWSLEHFKYQYKLSTSREKLEKLARILGTHSIQVKDRSALEMPKVSSGFFVPPEWIPPDLDLTARMELAPNMLDIKFMCESCITSLLTSKPFVEVC